MDEGVDKAIQTYAEMEVFLRWSSVGHGVQGQRVSVLMVRLERKDTS